MKDQTMAVPGLPSEALLREPDGRTRAGIVALPGSSLPQRRQPIFEHLAQTIAPLGYATLTFDRRQLPGGDDTPLDVQAADAEAAVDFLTSRIDGPVGLFGFSQGAWSASLAASRNPHVAFLALVGCSGVSPAEQMWFYSDELLRRAGYDSKDRANQLVLRRSMDDLYRGAGDRAKAQQLLEELVGEPWFDTAFPVAELPGPDERWSDIDYDPEPAFARVTVPTLLMYGSDEECVPPAPSKAAWRRAAAASGNERVTTIDIADCGHFPAPGESAADLDVPIGAFSTAYGSALASWLTDLELEQHDER